MGILDTHAVQIREILNEMNALEEEIEKLAKKGAEYERDRDWDYARINGLKTGLDILLGRDCFVEQDSENHWHIYVRWDE